MIKKLSLLSLLFVLFSCSDTSTNTQKETEIKTVPLPEGKEIYIPKELRGLAWQSPESQWSYHRMAYTDNFAIFWEKGFGSDLGNPPALEGEPMKVDLKNLEEKLESFYRFYRDELQFVKKDSKSERYRMMVMINYSLDGTAYGGDYDSEIGALWIAPNRVQDRKLNCIAHELGHSFQSQISCDGQGEAWGGCGFFEMTSQWMLWQVNPEWITDELYHWEAFKGLTHKAYLHLENIYHSPYVIEYWGMKRGLPFIAELYRQGKRGEDPVMTYKRLTGLDQEKFCDEMFDACRHIVNLDYPRAWKETRSCANQLSTKLNVAADGWRSVAPENAPENYGFNAIPLTVPAPGETVTLNFCGDVNGKGYHTVKPDLAGWRYGFVAVTQEGTSIYGDIYSDEEKSVTFTAPKEKLSHLWLVVMGAPKSHWMNPDGEGTDAQWGYKVKY